MIENWESHRLPDDQSRPSSDTLRRWIRSSLSIVIILSILFFSGSAFLSSPNFPWRCPACDPSPTPASIGSGLIESDSAATDLSHIVFGIGGSASTWHRRRGYSELWWRPHSMRGHVWLDSHPDSPWPSTCPSYRLSSSNFSRFGRRESASRIARIAAESYRAAPGARWFVMGDDDTVFFPENLVAVLSKYDHRQMYYVGAHSESVEQDVMHSYGMAFGGGGFALSRPAAAALAEAIDGCLDRYAYFYGSDQRVHACLAELGVPLTPEPGFHQVDVRGDAYGMLAAHPVAPLVSLHHLDYVKPITPARSNQLDAVRSLTAASKLDPARALQQSICYVRDRGFNLSVSVSWGYTVQVYPSVLAPKDLEMPVRTFQTWRSFKDGPFTFNTREIGPDRKCERPVRFFLDRVLEPRRWRRAGARPGTTSSEYSRFDDEPGKKPGSGECRGSGLAAARKVGTVRVVAPKMDPHVWAKAPRRQCCEAHLRRRGRSMEIRIRDCRRGEITSPP